ncbi:MAG: hypothetical protein WBG32_03435 [Nodosilinea sp.]
MANRLKRVTAIVQFFVLLSGVAIAIGAGQIDFSFNETLPELGRSPMRILFVGHSSIDYNGGIDHHRCLYLCRYYRLSATSRRRDPWL